MLRSATTCRSCSSTASPPPTCTTRRPSTSTTRSTPTRTAGRPPTPRLRPKKLSRHRVRRRRPRRPDRLRLRVPLRRAAPGPRREPRGWRRTSGAAAASSSASARTSISRRTTTCSSATARGCCRPGCSGRQRRREGFRLTASPPRSATWDCRRWRSSTSSERRPPRTLLEAPFSEFVRAEPPAPAAPAAPRAVVHGRRRGAARPRRARRGRARPCRRRPAGVAAAAAAREGDATDEECVADARRPRQSRPRRPADHDRQHATGATGRARAVRLVDAGIARPRRRRRDCASRP